MPAEDYSNDTKIAILQNTNTHIAETLKRIEQRLDKIDDRFLHLEEKFDKKFHSLEEKFDKKFQSLEEKFDEKFRSTDEKNDTKFNFLDKKMDNKFSEIDNKLDKVNNKLWELFFFNIAGIVGIFYLIAHVNKWF